MSTNRQIKSTQISSSHSGQKLSIFGLRESVLRQRTHIVCTYLAFSVCLISKTLNGEFSFSGGDAWCFVLPGGSTILVFGYKDSTLFKSQKNLKRNIETKRNKVGKIHILKF